MTTDSNQIYSGEDSLNVMKLATRYNNAQIKLIHTALQTNAKTILDFGSGDGWFAKNLKPTADQTVLCVEPADNMQKYYSTTDNLTLYTSSTQLCDGSVDFIYSLNVLEHIEDDKAIVNEFDRLLSSGGKVLLYLPAWPCLFSSMDKQVGHYRRYRTKDVNRLFDDNKWTVKTVKYADFCGWFIALLFKYIGNKEGQLSATSVKIYDKIIFPVSQFFDWITRGKICGKNVIIEVQKK